MSLIYQWKGSGSESVGILLSQKFSNMRVTAGDTEASKPEDMPI